MPLQQTSGNVTQDAYGGGVAVTPVYVEDVYSTFLYTGNGTSQSINNGIDLSTYGGMVWTKSRTTTAWHEQTDTVRGASKYLSSNSTNAQQNSQPNHVTAFNSNGFSVGFETDVNANGVPFASWTFRKQSKFFDVVTFTTASDASATVSHSLGSTPGFVVIKRTDNTSAWSCWHNGLTSTNYEIRLNSTAAQNNIGGPWLTVSSTQITFPGTSGYNNLAANAQYVMYLFAHNAGGFGLTGTDNVISCGSFTTNGSSVGSISLGYEPQWLLIKSSSATEPWFVIDNMRGMPVLTSGTGSLGLNPNSSSAEVNYGIGYPTATGFTLPSSSGLSPSSTYIYIAIRRGPMKTPTSGTSVFSPQTFTGSGTGTTNFPVDLVMTSNRPGAAANSVTIDRLRGASSTANILYLSTSSTAAEVSDTGYGISLASNTSFVMSGLWAGSAAYWAFQRAPGTFDEVCYTGNGTTGSARNHNLGVVPELTIIKPRSVAGGDWMVMYNTTATTYSRLLLDTTDAAVNGFTYASGFDFSAQPTATTFTPGGNYLNTNQTGTTYVAYLWATNPGVTKVGTYTGNGSTQTINCGFTSGSRFVLIKRTDSTGNWLTFDTARGMTTSTDPWLALNSTAAESATTGACTTTSVGFAVDESKLTGINTNGATYLFLSYA